MPESVRLLSEEESAKVAEVGVDTIRQYMQCGLLDPVIKDHRTFFQEVDIRTLFFTRTPAAAKTKPESSTVPVESKPESIAAKPIVDPDSAKAPSETASGPTVEVSPVLTAETVVASSVTQHLPSIANAELLEITKTLREQIHILRDERDWLRERVEKLESRSDREQMLLLSESENVRKLIQQGESKRLSWLRALPWFGERSGK